MENRYQVSSDATLVPLSYEKIDPFSLKAHSVLSEKWLQDRIGEDPSILGLGDDVELVAFEKRQPGAGRLDVLLHDEQRNLRFEVEIMLGATDPSHIIRTIEYWDIERKRYPAYEHVAVLVAEDITTRFLNVMSLLAGSIPLIAIQVAAFQIEQKVYLHFAKVLNQTELRTDDVFEATGGSAADADRATWESKVGSEVMQICDGVLNIANSNSAAPLEFKYKRHRLSISTNGSFFNVCVLWPKKKFVNLSVGVEDQSYWLTRLEELELDARPKQDDRVMIRVYPDDVKVRANALSEILDYAVKNSHCEM